MEPTQALAKTITCNGVEVPLIGSSPDWLTIIDRLRYWRCEAEELRKEVKELRDENDRFRDALDYYEQPDQAWLAECDPDLADDFREDWHQGYFAI